MSGDRPLTARAVARAALAASAAPPDHPDRADPLIALGMVADPSLRGAGPVPRRVAALLAPPPRTRLLLYGAVVGVVALSAVSALDAAAGLHQLIELAQGQPS